MTLNNNVSTNHSEMQQSQPGTGKRRSRRRRTMMLSLPSPSCKSSRSLILAAALLFPSYTLLRTSFLPPGCSIRASHRMNSILSSFRIHTTLQLQFADAKEIVATREWQRLGENDTIPAGLHVKMDLSTGEKWAKIAEDEERDEDIKAAMHHDENNGDDNENNDNGKGSNSGRVQAVEMDPGSGALSIVETVDASRDGGSSDANDNSGSGSEETKSKKDYEMMHRVMSHLPPDELERFGGLPALPSPTNHSATAKLTEAQREFFEERMERIWNDRQDVLAKAQESLADLPSMLRDRIGMITEYLDDVEGSMTSMLQERRAAMEDGDGDKEEHYLVKDVIGALRDLEFQLSDMDMARDFHTLGGWTHLVSLLNDEVHIRAPGVKENEEMMVLVDEIQALSAMTIGTAVGNLGEFHGWALEDVSSTINQLLQSSDNSDTQLTTSPPSSAISLLIQSFETELDQRSQQMNGNTMAVSTVSNDKYKSRATYKLRAVYALGSLLRGNPSAQMYFVLNGGAELLVRDVLGTLSNVRGGEGPSSEKALVKLDYKFASKVLALAEDVVTDVVLHLDSYIIKEGQGDGTTVEDGALTANRLVAAFAAERWCDLSLRMLQPPTEVIGSLASRGMKERALSAVRALGPGCIELSKLSGDRGGSMSRWGVDEVKEVRSEWNREGSDDGLDSVYRRELLDLVDGVLEALQ